MTEHLNIRCPQSPRALAATGVVCLLWISPLAAYALPGPSGQPDMTLSFGSSAKAPSTRPKRKSDILVTETSTRTLAIGDLIELAIHDSYQVKVSEAQVQQAKALYEVAVSLAYPQGRARLLFGGPTSEARTAVKNDVSTVTQASLEGDLNLGELGVSLRGSAEAAVPLVTFGKITKGKRASSRLIRAARHQVRATQAAVVVDLIRAYWGWQLLQSLVASLEEGEERLAGVLEQIEELLDADSGQVTENDRLRLKFALSTLLVRRAQAEGGLAQLEQAIRLLIGRKQSAPLTLEKERLEDAVPQSLPPLHELIAFAKHDRSDLQALREVVKAQKAFRELREAQMFPTLFFGGFINFAITTNATDQTNPFIKDPFNFFDGGVGLGIQLDLDFFTKLAQVEQANAELAVRRQQEALATEASELEVRSLYAQIEAEMEQAKRLERAHLSARGWLTAATLAYDIGAGKADELIDAFLAWATSVAELQSTRYDNLVHFAELARATGRLLQASPRYGDFTHFNE